MLLPYQEEPKQEEVCNVDWTPAKTNWNSRDFYNKEDLVRVDNNTMVLLELVKLYSFQPNISTGTVSDFPFATDLNRIEHNIKQLGARFKPPGWKRLQLHRC